MEPLAADDEVISRMRMVKTFTGDLAGMSVGQVLSVGTSIEGSAGHVAIEVFTGALNGQSGSFVLQHSGLMRRGLEELSITVVPDSGTEELMGLSGVLQVEKHGFEQAYVLQYSIEKR